MRQTKFYQCRFCTGPAPFRFHQLKAHERSNHPLALKAEKQARKAARCIEKRMLKHTMTYDEQRKQSKFDAQLAKAGCNPEEWADPLKTHQATVTISVVIATDFHLSAQERKASPFLPSSKRTEVTYITTIVPGSKLPPVWLRLNTRTSGLPTFPGLCSADFDEARGVTRLGHGTYTFSSERKGKKRRKHIKGMRRREEERTWQEGD